MWSSPDKKKLDMQSDGEAFTFLGRGSKFQGIMSFDGEVRIDGHLEGEIHIAGTLNVGEHAVIEGDINADVVVSGGKINGNIMARGKVQLLSPGIVVGTIKTPLLSIEEGVRFSGSCEAEGRSEIRTLEGARQSSEDVLPHATEMN